MSKNLFATDLGGFTRIGKPDFGWRSALSAAIEPHLLWGALAPEGILVLEVRRHNCNPFPLTLLGLLLPASPWNERHTTCI